MAIGFITWKCNAQPSWYRNPPQSSSGKFCYIPVHVNSNENVLNKALPKATSCIGGGFNPSGTTYSSQAQGSIEIGGRAIMYQRVRSKTDGHGGEYVLMMFGKKETKDLPKKATRNPFYITLPMSAAIPGTGQMVKKQGGKGALMLISFLGTAGSAGYFELQRQSDLVAYDKATTFEQRESLLNSMQKNIDYRNISAGVAGAIYLINVIDVLAAKSSRYVYEPSKKLNWDLAYNPVVKSPVIGLTFSIRPKI